jgi:hypothetical protein
MCLHISHVNSIQSYITSQFFVRFVTDMFSLKFMATDLQCMNWAFHHENHSRNALELLERLKFDYNALFHFIWLKSIDIVASAFCLSISA